MMTEVMVSAMSNECGEGWSGFSLFLARLVCSTLEKLGRKKVAVFRPSNKGAEECGSGFLFSSLCSCSSLAQRTSEGEVISSCCLEFVDRYRNPQ